MTTELNPKHKYAVIKWNAENVYRTADAIATYASEKLADKKTDQINDELRAQGKEPVYVTRFIPYML